MKSHKRTVITFLVKTSNLSQTFRNDVDTVTLENKKRLLKVNALIWVISTG